jgi:hypothetical protein
MKRIINKPPYPEKEPYLPYQCYECKQWVRLAAPIVIHDVGTEDVCRSCWLGLDYGFFYTDEQIFQKWGLMGLAVCVDDGYAMTDELERELRTLRGPNRIRE